MVLKPDQQSVTCLLKDTVTLLCKNGLNFNTHFSIEGLLGITLDNGDVFLVNINETVTKNDAGYQTSVKRKQVETHNNESMPPAKQATFMPEPAVSIPGRKRKSAHPMKHQQGSESIPSSPDSCFSPPHNIQLNRRDSLGNCSTVSDSFKPEAQAVNSEQATEGIRGIPYLSQGNFEIDPEALTQPFPIKTEPSVASDSESTGHRQYSLSPSSSQAGVGEDISYPAMPDSKLEGNHLPSTSGHSGNVNWQATAPLKQSGFRIPNIPKIKTEKKSDQTSNNKNKSSESENQAMTLVDFVLCKVCQKVMKRASFASHMKRHQGNYSHQCPVCGKGFCSRGDLNGHLSKHGKQKAFSCPVCNHSFAYKQSYNLHMRKIHNQEV